MFGNLGIGEIIIIAAIALVVLGPEKFPEYAKIAMRAYRDFRGYIDDIKREMAEELKPVQREIQQLARHNPEDYVEHLAGAIASIDEEPTKDKPAEAPKPEEGTSEASAPEVPSGQYPPETPPPASPEEPAQPETAPSETVPKDASHSDYT